MDSLDTLVEAARQATEGRHGMVLRLSACEGRVSIKIVTTAARPPLAAAAGVVEERGAADLRAAFATKLLEIVTAENPFVTAREAARLWTCCTQEPTRPERLARRLGDLVGGSAEPLQRRRRETGVYWFVRIEALQQWLCKHTTARSTPAA